MATAKDYRRTRELNDLLRRDHTLNGGILFGLEGHIIEIQARAMEVLNRPAPWRSVTNVSGMARAPIREAFDRIAGAFAKLRIPEPEVTIQINLIPPAVEKDGTWLDLPLAVILLQASGYLPDLPEHEEGDFILVGEVGLHSEVRRVPGVLSIAYCARPGQKLIVPYGNERECALILAKSGDEGCRIYPVATLVEVIKYFQGQGVLENALKNGIKFENLIPKAIDLGRIRGQQKAKDAACIAAAGGHNLLTLWSISPLSRMPQSKRGHAHEAQGKSHS